MKCSLIHLIYVIIHGSVVCGFSIPKVSVQLTASSEIQFSLQESTSRDVVSNAKIFIFASKDIVNKSRNFESELIRDDESGLWIYEISNVIFNTDDSIEYWLYVEHYGLGYFSDQMTVNIEDLSTDGGEKGKTKINPTFLTQSTAPKVNARLMGSNAIEFTVEENIERITDAWIFINFLTKNVKIIERQLVKDDERGVWKCEYKDSGLMDSDVIEYWMYFERNKVGFYSSGIIRINELSSLDTPTTKINPVFFTKSTSPKVNLRITSTNAVEFSIEDDVFRITDAWIFINPLKSSALANKVIEKQLKFDNERDVWYCEYKDGTLMPSDSIEYWVYVEKNGIGFYSSEVVKVEDLKKLTEIPQKLTMPHKSKAKQILWTQSTNPKVNLMFSSSNAIQFTIEDDALRITKAMLYITPLKSSAQTPEIIERQFVLDDERDVWHCEYSDYSLLSLEVIEYWMYIEKNNVGYYLSDTFTINDIALSSRTGEFEVDILDLIDVRADLDMPDIVHMIKNTLPPTITYPNSSVEVLSPKGLKFRVEETSREDPFKSVNIFMFKPKHLIKSGKFIEHHLTRDRSDEVWMYEMPDVILNLHDTIEYWIYAEKSNNLGYFTQHILAVQDIAPSLSEVRASTTTTARTSTNPIFTTTTTPISITKATTTTTPQPPTPSPLKCESAVSTVNGKSVGCKNSIIFDEDFNSDNLKYWNFDTRFPLDDSTADAEFTVYEKRSETSFIRDNMMVIKAESLKRVSGFDDMRIRLGSYNLKERCTPISDDDRECERQASFGYILPPVTSAYLSTRNKFAFKYGRVVSRVRGPIGDYLYAQLTLQPHSIEAESNATKQHLKLMFMRGNEQLRDGVDEIGGSRAYGGAILSKNPKNNHKWLKSKHFPSSHLGNDFHIYELLWTPTEISLSIDGIKYGSLDSNLRESAMAAKIKSAVNWAHNGPFDKEHFIAINMAAGSVKNFYSLNSTLLNGIGLEAKPWNDTDPRAERSFYMSHDKWYATWKRPLLEVDYIKIYAV